MADYSPQVANARRMIAAKGAACVWAEPSGTTDDPNKPWIETAHAPTNKNVVIAFFPLTRKFVELIRFVGGTEVVEGRQYGLMAGGLDFTPTKRGLITRTNDGAKFGIVSISPLAPDGTPILYTVELSQ